MYVLSAGEMCLPQELCIEKAQLYWQKGNQDHAFATLKRCLDNYFQPTVFYKAKPVEEYREERKQCAKVNNSLYKTLNFYTINLNSKSNF